MVYFSYEQDATPLAYFKYHIFIHIEPLMHQVVIPVEAGGTYYVIYIPYYGGPTFMSSNVAVCVLLSSIIWLKMWLSQDVFVFVV
jgi:hypothetical protein